MIYNKLQGTTSKSFILGKNGVLIETLETGELQIVTKDYQFILGKEEVEGLFENGSERTIASFEVIQNYITEQVEGITGDVEGVDELLQQISGIAAAIDNDPNFYQHVLRLQDKDGNAVDNQVVKGTTTFEKDLTIEGKIIGGDTLIIDPRPESDPDGTLGKVVIHGDLQIDGTTTTINSQTVDIVDKNITLAVGSLNAAASDGAGLTIDLGDDGTANISYASSTDSLDINKDLNVDGTINADKFTSTIATGTAPLIVASTTLVTNLNADKFDGADLETTITESDSKVPTSQAVLTYSVPKNISAMPSLTFSTAESNTEKENTYIYVYNETTGQSKKMPISEVHRPSLFTKQNDSEVSTVKIGDFVYIEQ
jgi:hypothetical protein